MSVFKTSKLNKRKSPKQVDPRNQSEVIRIIGRRSNRYQTKSIRKYRHTKFGKTPIECWDRDGVESKQASLQTQVPAWLLQSLKL